MCGYGKSTVDGVLEAALGVIWNCAGLAQCFCCLHLRDAVLGLVQREGLQDSKCHPTFYPVNYKRNEHGAEGLA